MDKLDRGMPFSIRIFIYLLGFGFSVSGGISSIAYLNLLAAGYRHADYFKFIARRPECLLLPAGLILITLSVFAAPKKAKE